MKVKCNYLQICGFKVGICDRLKIYVVRIMQCGNSLFCSTFLFSFSHELTFCSAFRVQVVWPSGGECYNILSEFIIPLLSVMRFHDLYELREEIGK